VNGSATRLFPQTLLTLLLVPPFASAEPHGDHGSNHGHSVYQRRAFEWKDHRFDHRHGRRHTQFASPPVTSGWFQRPYPYHLDYYKMRYGGSYAPYFGNLYGPPQVVTAPPYYGPYYGGVYEPGAGVGYAPPVGESMPPAATTTELSEGLPRP
jgi:hypothetical protein